MTKPDDTSRAQPVEDEFVNKFCIVYMLWVHKGVDILGAFRVLDLRSFRVHLDDDLRFL